MKVFVLALASIMVLSEITVVHAEDTENYVAVVSILTTKGTFNKSIIKTTENGVSYDKCKLLKDAWLSEFGESLESAQQELKKQGQHTAFEVRCERKE